MLVVFYRRYFCIFSYRARAEGLLWLGRRSIEVGDDNMADVSSNNTVESAGCWDTPA